MRWFVSNYLEVPWFPTTPLQKFADSVWWLLRVIGTSAHYTPRTLHSAANSERSTSQRNSLVCHICIDFLFAVWSIFCEAADPEFHVWRTDMKKVFLHEHRHSEKPWELLKFDPAAFHWWLQTPGLWRIGSAALIGYTFLTVCQMSMHLPIPIKEHFDALFCDAQYMDGPSWASKAATNIFLSAAESLLYFWVSQYHMITSY